MTTQTIDPAPAPDVQVFDTDDIGHVVRDCDADTALCGAHVPGDRWRARDEDGDDWCQECVVIENEGDTEHMAACAFCQLAEAIW